MCQMFLIVGNSVVAQENVATVTVYHDHQQVGNVTVKIMYILYVCMNGRTDGWMKEKIG